MKNYKITIERIEIVTEQQRRWERVDASDNSKYDYTPPIPVERERTTKIFEQLLGESEFKGREIVKAVNGL